MKLPIPTFAATLLMVVPVIAGCAGEEAEAGEAAYPPIGYTPPADAAGQAPSSPPVAVAAVAPAVPAPPAGAQAPSSGEEVVIGDGDAPAPEEGAEGAGYSDTDPAALSDFRSTLEPYGAWTDDPTYGTVWVPSSSVVGDDFTPYVSAGHWAYDSDYAWVSDYDWGWAPFHYGRWVYASGPGWEWIPGRTYAGAWVSWRYGVGDWGYVGWAPLAPTWCWRRGVAVGIGFVPRAPYAFVGTGELFHPNVGARVIAGPQVASIAAHTRGYAAPSVGGRVAARPGIGPSPAELHIAPEAVTRASVDNHGLAQARAFSRPSTAVASGARAPEGASFAARTAPGGWSQSRTLGSGSPAYRSYASSSSHFGGRLGGGFAGSAASAPPMRAPAYSSGSSGAARPYFGSAQRFSAPSSAFRGGPSATFRSAPSFSGARSAPAFSGASRGGFSGGSPRSFSGGGFHGGGSGGFHGGGGGGGHSGGGHR